MSNTPRFQRTLRALEAVKSKPWAAGITSVVTILGIVAGFWIDYRNEIESVGNIETKGVLAEDARIEKDDELQERMQFVFERAIELEHRLTTLEVQVQGLQESNATFLGILLRGGNAKPQKSGDKVRHFEVKTDYTSAPRIEAALESKGAEDFIEMLEDGEIPQLRFEPSESVW